MQTWIKNFAVVSLLLAKNVHAYGAEEAAGGAHISEVDYKFIDEASLDFPASKTEYTEWETMGAAMMYRDHALIVPQVPERRGQLMN